MVKIRLITRDWIRDNPVAYSLFLRLYLGRRLNLPDGTTDCHLTGYPRSANTYSHYLAKGIFPKVKFVTHVHTIASLKAARKHSVPVGLILRNPVDCVVSMCMKNKKEVTDRIAIEGYLHDYNHYHGWLAEKIPDAAYFSFETVTQDSVLFIEQLADFLNLSVDSENLPQRIKKIEEVFAARETMKDPDGSSLPKEGRERRKAAYVEAVKKGRRYSGAIDIYKRLLGKVKTGELT